VALNLFQVQTHHSKHNFWPFSEKKISGQIWPKVWPARHAPTHVLFDFDRFARVVFSTCSSQPLFQTLISLFSGPSWPRKNLIFFLLFKFGQDLPAAKNPVFRGALVLDISAVRQTNKHSNQLRLLIRCYDSVVVTFLPDIWQTASACHCLDVNCDT
jgi:hypothetical protein